jgi:hypothetical protein
MVNFASEVERLALVVKRKPGGRFCDWLFDSLSGSCTRPLSPSEV